MKTRLYLLVAGMLVATLGTGLCQPCITITSQPQPQANCIGTTATFSVVATGVEPLKYQWQQAYDLNTYVDRPEGTNATLIITNAQNLDAGNYRVIITNVECSVTSAVARLTIGLLPIITYQPTNFAVVSLGASVTNRVYANSTATMTYQWRFNGTDLPGQTKNTIILTNLQMTNQGNYDVVVANLCGSVTSSAVPLEVDTTFTKITFGPLVTNIEGSVSGSWADYDGDSFITCMWRT